MNPLESDALKRIEELPEAAGARQFFGKAAKLAGDAGLELVERAAQRALAAFDSLPDGYFDGKGTETYTFHATFPDYRQECVLPATRELSKSIVAAASRAPAVTLYYHVPYCAGRCRYCSFTSQAIGSTAGARAAEFERYFNAVWRERALWDLEGEVPSVYFGGGTPTVLPPAVLEEVLQRGKDAPLAKGAEVTCEASPGTLTEEKLEILGREASRISIGVQSLDDGLLRFVGRDHDAARAEWAVKAAVKKCGNVNMDLIYGLPGPDGALAPWLKTLGKAAELSSHSVTLYRYWRKPDSAWFGTKPDSPHEMLARLMYFIGAEALEEAGYSLAQLHWFAKGGKNREYYHRWGEGIPNVGFGVGAYGSSTSFVFRKTRDAAAYLAAVEKGVIPFTEALVFGQPLQQARQIFGPLRAYHKAMLSKNLNPKISSTIGKWVEAGLARENDGVLSLTDGGKALFDWMADDLLHATK